jgi:hypothetical protein
MARLTPPESPAILLILAGGYITQLVIRIISTYTLRVADLDGNNEKVVKIDKADYSDRPLVFFSLTEGKVLDTAPAEWDLLFCRYVTPLNDGEGGIINYNVTGVLSGLGVEVAELRGVDPARVDAESVDSFSRRLDAIGYEWKDFNFTTGWVIPDDLAYVVKLPDNRLYRLVFIDFEGASTGVSTFEQTYLGLLSSSRWPARQPRAMQLRAFPNPVSGQKPLQLVFEAKSSDTAILTLYNAMGQLVWRGNVPSQPGLNAIEIALPGLAAGMYTLHFRAGAHTGQLQLAVAP